MWDLTEARVLIDGRDFRIHEFFVRGRFLKRDYSMSFKLDLAARRRTVNEDLFQVPHLPDEIVITGREPPCRRTTC